MLPFRRILVPSDLSDLASRSIAEAVAIGRAHQSEIHAVHVIPQVLPHAGAAPSLPSWSLLNPDARAGAEERLRATFEPVVQAGLPVRFSLREGGVADEIVKLAREIDAHLLVMTTHARSGISRALLGSVTERAVPRAPCPVLTLNPHEAPSGAAFEKLVCAVDFSEGSMAALHLAVVLARASAAELTVVHAIPWLPELHSGRFPADPDPGGYRAVAEREAQARLDRAIAASEPQGCRIRRRVGAGRPSDVVLDRAREGRADLIVIGLHRHTALHRGLFGSTSREVARVAPCPVVTVRPGYRVSAAGAHALGTGA